MGQVIATMSSATKSFDKQKVLDNINLELQAGKIVGIIGPSGAGKSTAIRCLMGMEKLDQGSADIFDTKMPNRKILKRIGYMGQNDALYDDLSGKENLVFFGSLMGLTGTALDRAIEKNMQLVDLLDFLNKPVKTYSGGMKRRLSLAITLLSNPDLLVLDEPTVGIDPSLRVAIWEQLRELANNNKGIIMTTHVMDEAEKCDYVGLIIEGKLFAFGSPKELEEQFKVTSIEEVFLKAEVNAK
ncbi:ABC transporter ATP-binding protein [Enterococcus gallinarum]|uniref:ABC transporter ATP-binding protein n=1 Tax=Enterococcus gallinarum TaxID=1353 RepID=A0AAE4KV08_ENTGA|nr:ABC transporter ATP-binding protein [Enterococcus gallinarum]MBA0947387.1 ABC transporter ATP-binding protein [Enterococcus gallinarum]MBA0961378.1 ABC transporter ATP-binding protein [Enterococcus gallinarum]MBA0968480.1 ABC transporter ATP-binding protein [Enterococcus gallinarum]MBA0971711.1 ABC transporter ATP-binding protein [Enterococcus gallinarum]MBM6740509.1 ABC transporter ATP-binding protein [Enterococcus gallinarum]